VLANSIATELYRPGPCVAPNPRAARERIERARAELPGPTTQAKLARIARVLCDPVRYKIVRALRAGPLSVEDIAKVVGRTVPGTSQHLRVLRELGVVESQPAGRKRYYRLRPSRLTEQLERAVDMLTSLAA
jgi:DNA-binding transcriptional ArsR family regulator